MSITVPRPSTVPRPVFGTAVAALVLGVVLRAAFLLWHPPFDTDFYDLEQVSAWSDSWYPMHMMVGAPGFALLFVGLAGVTAALCARRAGVLAVAGGVVAAAGGLAFAFGLAAEGATWGWLMDPSVTDPATAAAVLRGIEAGPALTTPIILIASAVVIPLGVLAQLIALMLARTVPVWLPVATLAIMVLGLLPVPGLAPFVIALESIALAAIAVVAVRAVRADRGAVRDAQPVA